MSKLSQKYEAICNEYRDALNKMWGTDGDWISRGFDCFEVADCFISNVEMRYLVDNYIPWDTFIEWYEYNEQMRYGQELGKEDARLITISNWCEGFPEEMKVPEAVRREWEEKYWITYAY